jgi:hypothetical protein
MHYRPIFSDSAVEYFATLPRRRQRKLLDRARELAADPFLVPDLGRVDDDGREIGEILAFARSLSARYINRQRVRRRDALGRGVMFKQLVVQRLYHLSDEQAEYQVTTAFRFAGFLGLPPSSVLRLPSSVPYSLPLTPYPFSNVPCFF